MDVLTAPSAGSTTRTPPRARPLLWPPNERVSGRRRDAGHRDRSTGVAPRPIAATAPPRHEVRVVHRQLLTRLDRVRQGLVIALFAAATAAAALPALAETPSRPPRPAPAATPTTTTCAAIETGCCPGTPAPLDLVRDLRPTCS